MVEIDVVYAGSLHCTASHGPSGRTLETDAPVDNQGKGETFSPTDLLATALGTCMLTTMGIVAQRAGYEIGEWRARVEKHMSSRPPRRVAGLVCALEAPAGLAAKLSAAQRIELEQTAHTCPVRLSLLDAIEVPVQFVWND